VKISQELYEIRVSKDGECNEYTIDAGKTYAINLQKVDRGDEAMELLTKLLVTSKQVFGSDHNITKVIESELKKNEALERLLKQAALKQVVAKREILNRG
jgi:hypothetical protein